MKPEEILRYTLMAKRYHCTHSYDIQNGHNLRNRLYLELRPYLIKWLKSIYAEKNIFLNDDNLLSISWDCYLFCLKNYVPHKNIPLPNHFYSYAKFYVLSSKKENDKNIEQYKENEIKEQNDLSYELIDELKKFKEVLPKEYQAIFDDALHSLYGENKDRLKRSKETPIHYYRYCEAKKIMKIFIDFLLRK